MSDYKDMYLLAGSEVLSREFNDLAAFYSDFHKDVYGYRPRHMALCADRYESHEALVEAMSHLDRLVQGLQDYLTAMKSTFEGREQLRSEGWHIEETDPQYMSAAAENEALRAAERARMEYECSWEYHQEKAERAEEAKREELEDATEFWYWRKHEAV
jgi:hypothetical protein